MKPFSMDMSAARNASSSVAPTGACRERIILGVPIFQPELETLPRPELERLQHERLRERFGVEPEALADLPFTGQVRPARAYPFGLCGAARASWCASTPRRGTRGKPTIVGYTRADLDALGRGPGALARRGRRRGRATSSTSPTATASSPAASASTTAPSGSAARSCPMSGGNTAAPDAAAPGPRRRRPLLHALLRARRSPRRCASRASTSSAPLRRHLRRRAVDRGDARRDRARARARRRSTSTASAR